MTTRKELIEALRARYRVAAPAERAKPVWLHAEEQRYTTSGLTASTDL